MVTTRSKNGTSKVDPKPAKTTRSRQIKRQKVASEDEDKEEEENTEPSEQESDWESSKRRGKHVKWTKKTAAKKNKGQTLASMLSTPLDIQQEILSWLSPQDLLSISRASRQFRKILMSCSATSLWKRAREQSGIIAPPLTKSEPQWAAMLFDSRNCENCGAPQVPFLDFGICRRVCTKCKRKNLIIRYRFEREFPEYPEDLLELIPYTKVTGWSKGRSSKGNYYWRDDIHDMAKEWASLQDDIHRRRPGARQKAAEFRETRKALVKDIFQAIPKYTAWYEEYQKAEYREKHRAELARRDEIFRRLHELGFSDADIGQGVLQSEACQNRELTERIWRRIGTPMIARLHKIRHERVTWDRKQIFEPLYHEYLKNLSSKEWVYHPSIEDVVETPTIRAVIDAEWDADVTREDIQDVIAQIPESISLGREERKAELRKAVLEFIRSHSANQGSVSDSDPSSHRPDPLGLATSVFVCKRKSCKQYICCHAQLYAYLQFGWKGVSAHCCRSMYSLVRRGEGPMVFEVSKWGYEVATALVRRAGLDPETATVEEMDQTGIKYFCYPCAGRSGLVHDWRSAVAHSRHWDHAATVEQWQRLTDDELQRVKPVPQDSSQAKDHREAWACTRCNLNLDNLESRARVECHLKGIHQVESPVEEEDLVYFPSRRLYEAPNEECQSESAVAST